MVYYTIIVFLLCFIFCCYISRHTWATLARDYGAPISVISAGLGHTSEEMTRVYLKDFDVSMLNQVNSIVTNLSK